MLREVANGVIVGSAIVRLVEQSATKTLEEVSATVGDLAQGLGDALNLGSK